MALVCTNARAAAFQARIPPSDTLPDFRGLEVIGLLMIRHPPRAANPAMTRFGANVAPGMHGNMGARHSLRMRRNGTLTSCTDVPAAPCTTIRDTIEIIRLPRFCRRPVRIPKRKSAESRWELAFALFQADRLAPSVAQLERVLQLDPRHEAARSLLERARRRLAASSGRRP